MVSCQVARPYAPFDYGSAVRIKVTPNPYGVLQGSVFGFRKIDEAKSAEKIGMPVGTVLALIENELGDSFEVPISDLELM